MLVKSTEFELSAAGTYTDWISMYRGQTLDIDWVGLVDSVLTVQRRYSSADTIFDMASYDVDNSGNVEAHSKQQVRIGIKPGDYGSDTITVRIKG